MLPAFKVPLVLKKKEKHPIHLSSSGILTRYPFDTGEAEVSRDPLYPLIIIKREKGKRDLSLFHPTRGKKKTPFSHRKEKEGGCFEDPPPLPLSEEKEKNPSFNKKNPSRFLSHEIH